MKPSLIILAAGIGSRYGSLKQVDPVGPSGETIMDYSIFDAIRAGFAKVVFVIRKEIEAEFRETFSRKFEELIAVEYAYQEMDLLPAGFAVPAGRTKPWGTGHAVLAAAGKIHENFAVINADDFYGHESYIKMSMHLTSSLTYHSDDYAMVGFDLENTLSEFGSVSRGICETDENNYLRSVTERPRIMKTRGQIAYSECDETLVFMNRDAIASMNFWGFTPGVFPKLEGLFSKFLDEKIHDPKSEFYISTAIDDLIQAGQAKVRVLRTASSWFGVTYKEDKPSVVNRISSLVKGGIYPTSLWNRQ